MFVFVSLFGYVPVLEDYFLSGSLVINLLLGLILYRKYYFNKTPFTRVKIKKYKEDFPEYSVRVKNTGVIPLEIDPPVILFKKRRSKRLFQVRNGQTLFPLALFKKEEYEFIVDLAKFYHSDSSLITYKKVFIEIRDKTQKRMTRKRISLK
jgi:hypothetical protein